MNIKLVVFIVLVVAASMVATAQLSTKEIADYKEAVARIKRAFDGTYALLLL